MCWSGVVCDRKEREWGRGDVIVRGQVTGAFPFSAELWLRVPIAAPRGVVVTLAFFTGKGRELWVWRASIRRERAG